MHADKIGSVFASNGLIFIVKIETVALVMDIVTLRCLLFVMTALITSKDVLTSNSPC